MALITIPVDQILSRAAPSDSAPPAPSPAERVCGVRSILSSATVVYIGVRVSVLHLARIRGRLCFLETAQVRVC